MLSTLMAALVRLLHHFCIFWLITHILEMKVDAPNNIKTTQMHQCSVYRQTYILPLNWMIRGISR